MNHICITSSARRNPKARNEIFYLDRIRELGFEFDRIEAFCTDGDIRPPYPYQWIAYVKVRKGDDDACEGIGEKPLESLKNLYKSVKACIK